MTRTFTMQDFWMKLLEILLGSAIPALFVRFPLVLSRVLSTGGCSINETLLWQRTRTQSKSAECSWGAVGSCSPVSGTQLTKHSLLGFLPVVAPERKREKAIPGHPFNRCIDSLNKK